MAVNDSDKIDFLWKKVIFGVGKTASGSAKFGSNETIASALPVYNSNIWAKTDAASIPAVPPAESTETVEKLTGAQRIRLTNDPTSAPNVAWLATTSYGDPATVAGDFIPPTFGTGYAVKVWIGDPNEGPAARIFPDTANEEWVFDYNAGILFFPNNVPSAKSATVGNGTVSVASNGIYVELYRYTGPKGLSVPGVSSNKTYVVADIAQRDALTGLNAGDLVHVEDASGIASDAGPGEYAGYLWTGSAWRLSYTQDSARSDALSTEVTLSGDALDDKSLGRAGNNTRVVAVTVEVITPFDGDAAISVGFAGSEDRLMSVNENDLQAAGIYVSNPSVQFTDETEIVVYATGTSTVGECKVSLTYA